jgi:DNA-binding XRE family transcriptional regulator
MLSISKKIKKYRKKHGLSQERLGGKVGVPRQTIMRWENEEVCISLAMMKLLKYEGVL